VSACLPCLKGIPMFGGASSGAGAHGRPCRAVKITARITLSCRNDCATGAYGLKIDDSSANEMER
jgi:hypothetical protein